MEYIEIINKEFRLMEIEEEAKFEYKKGSKNIDFFQ
jgi:hypothetical protein